jgi:hypothetical protein
MNPPMKCSLPLGYSQRVGTKETPVTAEEVQFLIDLVRASAKVDRPAIMEQVVDYSFVEGARRDLGLTR